MVFILHCRTGTLSGQSTVVVQECSQTKAGNKVINIKNFGSYFIHQLVGLIGHNGSIQMSNCVSKSSFNQWIRGNARSCNVFQVN